MNDERLLTVNEVAHILRVSPQSVRKMIDQGQLRARRVYFTGRSVPRYRIPESALAEWNNNQPESA